MFRPEIGMLNQSKYNKMGNGNEAKPTANYTGLNIDGVSGILYQMNLHESINDSGMTITRVIGGWIYEIPRGNTSRVTSQFVPYNNEFQHYR